MLYKQTQALLPGLNNVGATPWMGFRPSLPDFLPVIDRADKHPGIYFAFGHNHQGVTQAAITGKLISELVSNQKLSIDITPFSINRFDSSFHPLSNIGSKA